MKKILAISLIATITFLASCKKDNNNTMPEPEPVELNTVPAFYKPSTAADYGKTPPSLTVVLNADDRVRAPWDLDFNPFKKNELWIINKGTESTGGSTVIVSNAGLEAQTSEYKKDENAWHFMSLPSAISFSRETNTFATTADVQDANHSGGTFTGPTLWSSDLTIYAQPSGGNGSHLDMLHGSPYAVGIEAHNDNAFWVVDGYNEQLVWYDFAGDHGPGADDHSNGKIHRYTEISLKRQANVASHLVLDRSTSILYIADAGNKRILEVNTATGAKKRNMPFINEGLAEHWEMKDTEWSVFADKNLLRPSGIEIVGKVLYVSDNESGDIIAYDIETKAELARLNTGSAGIMGIKADEDGKLWYVNATANEVIRIDPQ